MKINEVITNKASKLEKLQSDRKDLKQSLAKKLKDLNQRENKLRAARAKKLRDSKKPENLAKEMGEIAKEVRADEIGISIR